MDLIKIFIPNLSISFSNPFPVSKLKTQTSAGFPGPVPPGISCPASHFPSQHQPPNIWVVVELGAGSATVQGERMFLCYFQSSQNRDLQKAPHKSCFLPPHHSEKLGEILPYLPSAALYETETIKKEGEGVTETPASSGFFGGFVCCFFSFFWFKLEFWSPSSLLCAGGGCGITKIYWRPPLIRILLSPILKFLFFW